VILFPVEAGQAIPPGYSIERGYQAFRALKGSEEFLGTVTSRELGLLNEWFGNDAASGVKTL
jgi:hypothetical protein